MGSFGGLSSRVPAPVEPVCSVRLGRAERGRGARYFANFIFSAPLCMAWRTCALSNAAMPNG
jgi:hypothetical protein